MVTLRIYPPDIANGPLLGLVACVYSKIHKALIASTIAQSSWLFRCCMS